MKRFVVPDDITLVDPRTKVEIGTKTFREYAFDNWLNDPRLAQQRTDLYRLVEICRIFDSAKAGDMLEIEDADYIKILEVVKSAQLVYSPLMSIQLLAFGEAVERAT